MAMNNTLTLALFDRLAESQQETLNDSFAKRHENISKMNSVMLTMASECRRCNWKTHEAIWNPCLFLNTVALDLSYLVHDLAYEKDAWSRGLTARHLASLLFEMTDDLPQVFGKHFNDALQKLGVANPLRDAFRAQIKAVSQFWTDHRAELKQIRTICGAHRDHDAMLLLQTIGQVDLIKILQLGVTLGAILNSVGPAAQAILTATSVIKPPELNT